MSKQEYDAIYWAAEFIRIKDEQKWKLSEIDENLMIAWFANAMFANAMFAQEMLDKRTSTPGSIP